MMLYVKYRMNGVLQIVLAGDTLELAEAVAESVRTVPGVAPGVINQVEILIDLETADETARAMAFTPPPLLPGLAGYGTWHGEAPNDVTDVSGAAIAGTARRTTEE